MGWVVVTIANLSVGGGIPVVDVTASAPKLGLPVSEATAGAVGAKLGVAVTKVASGGIAVTYVAPPL